MDPALADRIRPYADQAGRAVEAALADLTPEALRDAALHYPRAGGKRLRPVMAGVAAEAAGGGAEDGIPVAVAVELIHNFSLVHDDVMDEDDLRRGRPTVHRAWDVPTAILAGDVLFARAFEVITETAEGSETAEAKARALAAVREVSETVRVLCEGQALDMAFERGGTVTEGAYLRMIHGKTARLFEAACRGGAMLAGASPAVETALATYGRAFGMAFQVHDDLLDLTGTTEALGKPALSDVRRGKRTLVLILAEARAGAGDRALMDRVVGNADASEEALRDVVALFEKTGALEEARRRVDAYTQESLAALEALPESPAVALLRDLAAWAGTRGA